MGIIKTAQRRQEGKPLFKFAGFFTMVHRLAI